MITTNCPIPFSDSDCVLLAHGGGGRMTHQLISSIFYPAFRKSLLEQDHGGCVIGVVPKGVHIAPDAVRGASEILGLDPLYIANEGLVLVILPDEKTEQALAVMQNYPEGKNAAVIGCIQEKGYALVKMKTLYGNYRIVDMLSDEQLPRI